MTVVFLTNASTSPYDKPGDWSDAGHQIELVGCGGRSGAGSTGSGGRGGGGGGGGAYVELDYSSGALSATTDFYVGINTTLTTNVVATKWGSASAAALTNSYYAENGRGGLTTSAGAAGSGTTVLNGTPPTPVYTKAVGRNGGGGGAAQGAAIGSGAGGGGAAGPQANGGLGATGGLAGIGGSGGGAGNATNNGATTGTSSGANGGAGVGPGHGGGAGSSSTTTPNGSAGVGGQGGGGGAGSTATSGTLTMFGYDGGPNGNVSNWVQSSDSATAGAGAGGGGGGSGSGNGGTKNVSGGNGGDYGGGGAGPGGSRNAATQTQGTGASGLIVITYTAVPPSGTLVTTDAPDVVAINALVPATGTLVVTEGPDVASFPGGTVLVSGTLATTEAADTVSLDGTVGTAGVTGTLAATEAADTASGAAATVAFQQAVTTTGSSGSRTLPFTVASAAGQERLVALVAIAGDSPTVTFSSVLVDGQTATQVGSYVNKPDTGGGASIVTLWRAAGTANTSINVTFTIATGNVFDARGAVWSLNNAGALLDSATATLGPTVSGDLSLDTDTVSSGAAAAVFLGYNSTTRAATWVGLTESFDGTAGSLYGNDWFSTANLNVTTSSTPLTITADLPSDFSGSSAVAGLAVSFGPASAGGFTGNIVWLTTLAATEAPDVVSINGTVLVSGTLAVSEAADIASLTGDVGTAAVTGTLAVTEASDVAAVTSTVVWNAALAVTEAADAAAFPGATVAWTAVLAATETADTAAFPGGKVEWSATLAATEAADVVAITGNVRWLAALVATEAPDVAALTVTSVWYATLAAWEADQYELLLHLDGADASTIVPDSGGSNHAVTAHGAAQIDTQSVFDGQSLQLASDSDYLSADTGDYAFGTDDFCIDFRVRLSSASAPQMFYDGGVNGPQIFYDGSALQYSSTAGTITGSALAAATNYHIAATRASGSTRLWKDGVQQGSTLADATSYGSTSGYPRIGGSFVALPRVPWEGGPSYWAQFPKADAAGWSDPSFFPIAVFLAKSDSGHPEALAALGINTAMTSEHQTPVSNVTDHLFLIAQSPISHTGEWSVAEVGTDPNVVGWFLYDECEQGEGACGFEGSDDDSRLALFQSWAEDTRALADGRFLFANFGNGVLHTFWATDNMSGFVQTVDGCACDKYAYTSPSVQFEIGRSDDWIDLGGTEANAKSSAAYGWFMDQMQGFDNPSSRRPMWGFFETKMPYLGEADATIITYAQLEGAVWSAIAHEARGIAYFQHNGFYTNPPYIDPNTGVAPIESTYSLVECEVGLQDAVELINTRVTALAPVLNTQSYVFNFGATGIHTMLKASGGYAYIFASVGIDATTGSKTFTLTGSGITGTSVEVVYESRSLTVTGGSFTDTFANEYSHHIYKVAL